MKREASSLVVALAAILALVPRPAAAQQVGGRQWFDDWQWSEGHVYRYTTYHFRSKPNGPEQTHRVVWYPNSKEHREYFYYFNQDSELIWCRAEAWDHDNSNLWQVLDDDEKRETIGEIASGTWDRHTKFHPTIPGSDDGTLMLVPPLPPSD